MPWHSNILQNAVTFERAVVTPYTFATTFIPAYLSYYAMAVLVQLPRSGLYRAALLPVVCWTTFRAMTSLDFSWHHPGYAYLNQGLSLAMFIFAMRSATWAFAKRPYARQPIHGSHVGTKNVQNGPTRTENGISVPSALWNAWDLTANLRGIGWSGPQEIRIRTPYIRVESRPIFALISLCRFVLLMIVFDAACTCVRSLGLDTFGTSKGGTIFDPSLSPSERYKKSLAVTLLSGMTAYLAIEATYQFHALLFTVLFQQYPSQWPPLFDSPWLSTSLISLWGQRWHQLFRECFVAVGSKPMERRFGRAGIIIGAFTVSGILHDVGMRGMGRGSDTFVVVGFFLMHGIGVLMEHAWKKATGRRVGGVVGWLWVACWLVLWGQYVVDVWARTGMLASEFFPEAYKPATLILNWIYGSS